MTIKSRNIDTIMLAISVFCLIGGLMYFEELSSLKKSNDFHPLRQYLSNNGIFKISTVQLILAILMTFVLVNKLLRRGKNEKRFLLICAITFSLGLAIIPWIELWYGSTFYYGEVRDKQGLGFPKLSLFFSLYPIWIFREEIITLKLKQLTIRIVATIIIIISTSIFYGQIYEPWKLWQS